MGEEASEGLKSEPTIAAGVLSALTNLVVSMGSHKEDPETESMEPAAAFLPSNLSDNMLVFELPEGSHGPGPIKYAWQGAGQYVATAGYDPLVRVRDRHGEMVEEIAVQGTPSSIAWDKDGDVLAIVAHKAPAVALFDLNTRRTSQLDAAMGIKDSLTFAVWSRLEPVLVVGSAKGNMLLYNHRTARKVPVMGKHTKKITTGAFSDRDLVALGGDDAMITVSNLDGDTVGSYSCTANPSAIAWATMKESERTAPGETTISAIIGGRALMLININDSSSNPINLQFQSRYGEVKAYQWFGDGYIMLAFEKGWLVSISTHAAEIGSEIFSIQDFKTYSASLAISPALSKCITVGDACIKMRELKDLNDVSSMTTIDSEAGLDLVNLTPDGSLLSVSTINGGLFVYLTRLPLLGSASGTRILALTSLTQLTLSHELAGEIPLTFNVPVEPTFVALGHGHIGLGMNNRAWFYRILPDGVEGVTDMEYLGSVSDLKLNGVFAAALFEGKIQVHPIEGEGDAESQGRIFPEADKSAYKATCLALTDDFLIFATDAGHIQYYNVEEWKTVNEFRHVMGVVGLEAEPRGTRLAIRDERGGVFLYSPLDDALVPVPLPKESPTSPLGVLWDNCPADPNTFIAYDAGTVYAFVHYGDTISGSRIEFVGKSRLPFGQHPLMLYNGELACQTGSGKMSNLRLDSLVLEEDPSTASQSSLLQMLTRAIVTMKWGMAWTLAEALDDKESWARLGSATMEHLEVELAIKIFRMIADVGMVWALEDIRWVEDRNLLAGHLAMYLGRFDEAEALYLDSTQPTEALEMRRDLLDWDKALALANRLAPSHIPFISKEYAQQLEFTGDYAAALSHYEEGLLESEEMEEHNGLCKAGMARMLLRTSDIRRGVELCLALPNRQLKRECGQILESMKQFKEASLIYEKGQFYDRAAAAAIKGKNWMRVGELAPNVRSPKIQGQYAKALEAEKKYKQAAEAYRAAKDVENLVRILLDHLGQPDIAVKAVKESSSVEGAKLVAKFFMKLGDHGSAIQFLLISHCNADAYRLAAEHGKMESYAELLGDNGSMEEYEQLAGYFEAQKENFYAGKFFFRAGQYSKALSLLMRNGEDGESLALAIDCVGVANEPELSQKLLNFLMGELDGVPKEAKHLFRLYMALKMYREAGMTAVIIAREEQNNGNYRVARDVLFGMWTELRREGLKIPAEMETNLMLVHSYLLVKSLIKRGEHGMAARILIRVAENISRFPAHQVPILTSGVIECSKAGLKKSAFNLAAQLMRPENRKKVDEKYRKKLEGIVRKGAGEDEVPEPLSPCLYCPSKFPASTLQCNSCKSSLPFCIVTGAHMSGGDISACPKCRFPASLTQMKKLMEANEACPMCGQSSPSRDLKSFESINDILK